MNVYINLNKIYIYKFKPYCANPQTQTSAENSSIPISVCD